MRRFSRTEVCASEKQYKVDLSGKLKKNEALDYRKLADRQPYRICVNFIITILLMCNLVFLLAGCRTSTPNITTKNTQTAALTPKAQTPISQQTLLSQTPTVTDILTEPTIAPQLKDAKLSTLEDEVRQIIKSEKGVYSVAYMNLSSKNKIVIHPGKMRSASVIKLFIMLDAMRQIKAGIINEKDSVTLRQAMKTAGSGTLSQRTSGTTFTISELIDFMITESDNTATNMLIDQLNMSNINQTIQSYGFGDTVLQRKMMDSKSMQEGRDNFTSVTDLQSLLDRIYQNQCLGVDYDTRMIAILKKQKNKTKIPLLLPQNVVIANKTGELDGVENDVGIIYKSTGSYILCIMANEISEATHARNIIAKISKTAYERSGV